MKCIGWILRMRGSTTNFTRFGVQNFALFPLSSFYIDIQRIQYVELHILTLYLTSRSKNMCTFRKIPKYPPIIPRPVSNSDMTKARCPVTLDRANTGTFRCRIVAHIDSSCTVLPSTTTLSDHLLNHVSSLTVHTIGRCIVNCEPVQLTRLQRNLLLEPLSLHELVSADAGKELMNVRCTLRIQYRAH